MRPPPTDTARLMYSWSRRQDDNSRGPARYQTHVGRHVIKSNPHRHALRQPHPTEGGVHVGEQVGAALSLAVCDAARNALDMALDHRSLANQ